MNIKKTMTKIIVQIVYSHFPEVINHIPLTKSNEKNNIHISFGIVQQHFFCCYHGYSFL